MNAYWYEILDMKYFELVDPELGGFYDTTGVGAVVYAKSRSQARYLLWREWWKVEEGFRAGDYMEFGQNGKHSIRLLIKGVDHEPGVEIDCPYLDSMIYEPLTAFQEWVETIPDLAWYRVWKHIQSCYLMACKQCGVEMRRDDYDPELGDFMWYCPQCEIFTDEVDCVWVEPPALPKDRSAQKPV